MVMANDMALITFLPLGWFVLSSCGKTKYTAFVFVMQNVAANLGGMLTPFGNPQNLYLYSFYSIEAAEFFKIMALPFAVAFLLIAGTCFFVKPEPIKLETAPQPAPPVWRTIIYFILFIVSVMIVFRVFEWWIGLIAVTAALLILEPKSFLLVDYGLLLTFCAFFIFSGNMSRIPAVQSALGSLVALSPLLVGTASCQVISNVPSAVLLSRFPPAHRGEYRRLGHARVLTCQPYHFGGIPQARTRQDLALPRTFFTHQLCVSGDIDRRKLLKRPYLGLNFQAGKHIVFVCAPLSESVLTLAFWLFYGIIYL